MIVLHENRFGSVAKCECCNKYSLRLGTVVLPATTYQMKELIKAFKETLLSCFSAKSCQRYNSQTRVNFALNAAHMSLSLCRTEILMAIEVLEVSVLMLEVNKIIVADNQ